MSEKSKNKGIVEGLLGMFGKYDFLCVLFPGMSLYALLTRFTKFANSSVNFAIWNVVVDILIASVTGICIDALGSMFGRFFVTQKRVKYDEYLKFRDKGKNECERIKPNLHKLELRRVMYRNISVVWMLFFGVKFYELLVAKHQMAVNDVSIIIIALVGAFVCVYNSRRIDRYKQRRIKICFGTDADKLNIEK